jgi:hypothetical protein
MGVTLENITLFTLHFPHGQVLLAGYKDNLVYTTCKLKETYQNWGLDFNLN